jgi:hypothetical protein
VIDTTWKPTQVTSDEITPTEWNEFAQCLLNVSANTIPFSSNSKILYAGSSQVKGRFKSSSNVWTYASSQYISGGYLHTHIVYGNSISGIAWPTYAGHAANKSYVDTISGALEAKIGTGTLSGPLAANIGSDGTYGITGTKFVSSQMIAVRPSTDNDAVLILQTDSNEDCYLKFRESDTLGFSWIYSGSAALSWNNTLDLWRYDSGDSEKIVSFRRDGGATQINTSISGSDSIVATLHIKAKESISGVTKVGSPIFHLSPQKRPSSTPVMGEIWLSGTTTVCGGFYGCTGSRWVKFSMV